MKWIDKVRIVMLIERLSAEVLWITHCTDIMRRKGRGGGQYDSGCSPRSHLFYYT